MKLMRKWDRTTRKRKILVDEHGHYILHKCIKFSRNKNILISLDKRNNHLLDVLLFWILPHKAELLSQQRLPHTAFSKCISLAYW